MSNEIGSIDIQFQPMAGIAIAISVPAGAAHGDPVKLAALACKAVNGLIDGFAPVAVEANRAAQGISAASRSAIVRA